MSSDSVERLGALMTEIGAIENFGLVAQFGEEPLWQVIISEQDAPILVEVDRGRQVLVLSSELGTPMEGEVDRLNSLALDYAHLYFSTGGARLSRNKEDGIYSLIADRGLEGVSRQDLGQDLRRFATLCSGWRDILAAPRGDRPATDRSSEFNSFILRA